PGAVSQRETGGGARRRGRPLWRPRVSREALPTGKRSRARQQFAGGAPGHRIRRRSSRGRLVINSDEQLVLQAVAGDERALCALLERHGPIVRDALQRAYHRRLKGEVELDDIMQVTYLEAFLRIGAFISTGPASFGAWLR